MSTNYTALSAYQKILFLRQIQEYLMLPPEEYRLLIIHILRQHRKEQTEQARESVRQAA